MFKDRVKAFMLIFVVVGLASFYDFLLFFDGYRLLLASFSAPGAPVVLFAVPWVAISPHLLGLFGALYAPLGLAGLLVRATLVRTTISAVAVFQLVFAAAAFLMFGPLSRIDKAAPYVIFAVLAALWANGREASKAFAPAVSGPGSGSGSGPASASSAVAASSRSLLWVVSFIFSSRFLLPLAFAAYLAYSWHAVRPPAPAVFEKPRAVPVSGDYRVVYKYNVFVPAGFKMQNIVSVNSALSAREFACVLTRGDERIMITDNRGRLMDTLRNFAVFFYRPDERDLIKTVINDRFGLVSVALRKVFGASFAREAITPYLSGFCSDGGGPFAAGARGPGYVREFTLWDAQAAGSVLVVFSAVSSAFDPAVLEAVIASLRMEERVRSAADYYAAGAGLYAAGRAEDAKYQFASALYYNFRDYASHYYIARCFRETGASDATVMFHLNAAVSLITADRSLAGGAALKPLASPAEIGPVLERLSGLIAPSAPAQTSSDLPGFFY